MCRVLVALSFFSLCLAGCGRDDGRDPLSGNVTFDGKPLVYGEIVFRPAKGPEGSATVRDGKYSTDEGGQGITKGPNTMIITGYAAEPVSNADETKVTEAAPPLFTGYQQEVDLNSESFDIAVPAEAAAKK
ncbi:MAG: hypothetical protein NT138_20800 [Planctomycetales bacterium]|nr:hypothetical protein [Planctomycetales bacterium]